MYTPAICLLVTGMILLILNSYLFFRDYKEQLSYPPQKKKNLYLNGVVLLETMGVIVLGVVYLFMINNQL
ncbi:MULTISPECIES: hypothetical protein [Enterococcus]|uniref:hypothetical protein n=1 Tax=Enterococcus TaxID=1350 RepID=UPI000878FDB2|nr:hypothetical protein [Enterococcus faecalis]EGO2801368.1 hypothetical protein [Enterococcus faecalis]EGO2834202.1 hypothetical protein [Enterococcus faecalis]EGO8511786.1 hypothetical protein [Enterococcus faecalis]EGO9445405.1 hypothetical protein [Enterococcus faecalis]EGQ7428283.1 hypothetical protein [Enterococcus faecalis]